MVQPAPVLQSAGPGEDGGDGVGGGGVALLVLAEVPRHCAVRRLALQGLAVGRHQHTSHQTQRPVPYTTQHITHTCHHQSTIKDVYDLWAWQKTLE